MWSDTKERHHHPSRFGLLIDVNSPSSSLLAYLSCRDPVRFYATVGCRVIIAIVLRPARSQQTRLKWTLKNMGYAPSTAVIHEVCSKNKRRVNQKLQITTGFAKAKEQTVVCPRLPAEEYAICRLDSEKLTFKWETVRWMWEIVSPIWEQTTRVNLACP